MIAAQNTKAIQVLQPTAVAAETETAVEIDTLGFDYLNIYVICGALQAALTACKLSEGDTSGGVFTDIAAATVGNAACLDVEGSAVALSALDDNDALAYQVNLIGRKRFIKFTSDTAAGGTSTHAVLAILSRRGEIEGDTNANYITASTGTAKVVRI